MKGRFLERECHLPGTFLNPHQFLNHINYGEKINCLSSRIPGLATNEKLDT